MRTGLLEAALGAVALTVATLPQARANLAVSVSTPQITEGETEVELIHGVVRERSGASATGTALKLGHAPTAWWAVELSVLWHREPDERFGYDAWEVENRFALTEPGQYPVDLGLLVEVERPKDRSEGWEVRWGPLLQTQWGALQANLNLLFERHLRAAQSAPTGFGYQWQLGWRADPVLDWGGQGFGSTGPWRHWSAHGEQSHQIGPALFGKLRAGSRAAIKYDAAFLLGTGGAAPRRALRARVEAEF